MSTVNLLSRIESSLPFLSDTDKRLADYIMKNPADVVSMSTKALAKASDVSEAAVIRFAKKIDMDGYTDLKLQLSADLAADKNFPTPTDIKESDSTHDIYKKLAAFTVASIESTAKTLDPKALDAAVDLIHSAAQDGKKIYLNGLGTSSILAKEMQVKLMRLGIQSIFYDDPHLRLESLTLIGEGDIFICFTALGKSEANQQNIQLAHDRGADIILITQFGNHKLAEKSTVTLFTSITENNLRLISQTSFTVQSIIIDALFMGLATKDYEKIKQEVVETKAIFSEMGYYTK